MIVAPTVVYMDAADWPNIAKSLLKPWPEQAVLFDLQWWRSQFAKGTVPRVPGEPFFVRRWGWSKGKTRRRLLESRAAVARLDCDGVQ